MEDDQSSLCNTSAIGYISDLFRGRLMKLQTIFTFLQLYYLFVYYVEWKSAHVYYGMVRMNLLNLVIVGWLENLASPFFPEEAYSR